MDADTTRRQIRKTRYCHTYQNQYFEIDVYPFWDDKAYLEIEVDSENTHPPIPDFIEIIKDVTADKRYRNTSLAQSILTDDLETL